MDLRGTGKRVLQAKRGESDGGVMANPNAIAETKDWLRLNMDPDATDQDAIEHLEGECGRMPDGSCTMAGSEYCDFECPFSE